MSLENGYVIMSIISTTFWDSAKPEQWRPLSNMRTYPAKHGLNHQTCGKIEEITKPVIRFTLWINTLACRHDFAGQLWKIGYHWANIQKKCTDNCTESKSTLNKTFRASGGLSANEHPENPMVYHNFPFQNAFLSGSNHISNKPIKCA